MIHAGLDILIKNQKSYKNRKIALIANQTSVSRDLTYSWELLQAGGDNLRRIFAPEHGIYSTEQDQIPVHLQPQCGCEVVSLYGNDYNSLIPDSRYLDDIDLVIFDIQDVGARYYTYVNTMALFMKEIEGRDIELLICDRPNPLGGLQVEGPLIEEDFFSFVGIFPVPVRHGLTPGELALLYRDVYNIDIKLNIVRMKGWHRSMLYPETGFDFIPPSPNMPTVDTAYLYPGGCLLEGTNLSEGRGTAMPFKVVGAPFVEAEKFAQNLNSLNLKGVLFRPFYFKPTYNKYADEVVGGVYIHIVDIHKFEPFLCGVAIVKTAFELYPDDFKFLQGVYEFNDTHPAFDLLTGSSKVRSMIEEHRSVDDIRESWKADEDEFFSRKEQYHLY